MGDTVTSAAKPAEQSLGGYEDPKPMVFSGLFPIDGSDYPALRDALDKLKLNDAALIYEPETSAALGFGSAVASWVCCTWRLCVSAWNASSTWT